MTMGNTYIYRLTTCGTDKYIGVGIIGNFGILFNLIFKYKCNVYMDMYTNGHCMIYDMNYEKDFFIKNPFEYYVEPLFNVNNITQEVFIHEGFYHNELMYGEFDLQYKESYDFLKKVFFDNYKFKDDIMNEVNDFEIKYFKGDIVLGVQVRMTDFMLHCNNYDIQYFIEKIRNVFNLHKITKLFIATDNNQVITIFKNLFPNIELLYLKDIERVDEINSTVPHFERLNTSNNTYKKRKYHNYLCGKEAIVDMLLLSRCDYLIKSKSSLSDMALIFNEKIKQTY